MGYGIVYPDPISLAEGKPIEITRNATAARWTFVIGKDGKIAYRSVKVNPGRDAQGITEFIAKVQEKRHRRPNTVPAARSVAV